jgi:hypothetical protein
MKRKPRRFKSLLIASDSGDVAAGFGKGVSLGLAEISRTYSSGRVALNVWRRFRNLASRLRFRSRTSRWLG